MEIHQLRHMLAAAEHTSYAQAAKSCFTSRQNIAHSIKALESELGIVLFERRGNEMLLTPAGRQLASEAGEIVARVDGLHVAFANSDASDAVLNLAVSTNLFAGIPPSTDEFIAQHADRLRIAEASCADCYRFVCSGKADVAVIMCMERKFPECDVLEIGESATYALTSSSSTLGGGGGSDGRGSERPEAAAHVGARLPVRAAVRAARRARLRPCERQRHPQHEFHDPCGEAARGNRHRLRQVLGGAA